jgi:hypothetical protein
MMERGRGSKVIVIGRRGGGGCLFSGKILVWSGWGIACSLSVFYRRLGSGLLAVIFIVGVY